LANFSSFSIYFASIFVLAGCAVTTIQEAIVSPALSPSSAVEKEIQSTAGEIKILGRLPSGLTLESLPGEYVTEYVTVIKQEAWGETVLTPSEYQWVEGEVKGVETEIVIRPSWFETVTEKFIFQEEVTEIRTRPGFYVKDGTRVELVEVIQQVIPAITKKLNRRVEKNTAGPVLERVTPYEIKDGKTRVPVKTFPPTQKIHPAVTAQVERRMQIKPQTYIIKDDTGQILHRFETREEVVAFLE